MAVLGFMLSLAQKPRDLTRWQTIKNAAGQLGDEWAEVAGAANLMEITST